MKPPPRVILSGVNDEPSPTWDLDESLAAFEALGWRHLALRAVDKTVVDDMDDATYAAVLARLRERGFAVTSYLSMKLGRDALDDDNTAPEHARLDAAIRRAHQADTTLIRMMAYRRGACPDELRLQRTIDRLAAMADRAAREGITLGVEMLWPARDSIGGSPFALARVMQTINSPHLRVILDPGNTVSFGEDLMPAIDDLIPYVVDVHVKDCTAFGKRDFCLPGDGVAEWPALLRRLASAGYSHLFTIEPHLQHGQQHHVTGHEGFVAAGRRLESLLAQAGLEAIKEPTR